MYFQLTPKYVPVTTPIWTRGAKTHISAGDARNAHTPICRFVPRPAGGHYYTTIINFDTC